MEEGQDFNDLILERNLFKARSQEYRTRCANLESKIERLEQLVKEAKAREKKIEKECHEEIGDLELRLVSAIDTIEALKSIVAAYKEADKEIKIEHRKLLEDFNNRTAEARWFAALLKNTAERYDESTERVGKLVMENDNLRAVNGKFLEEIRQLNARLNE